MTSALLDTDDLFQTAAFLKKVLCLTQILIIKEENICFCTFQVLNESFFTQLDVQRNGNACRQWQRP